MWSLHHTISSWEPRSRYALERRRGSIVCISNHFFSLQKAQILSTSGDISGLCHLGRVPHAFQNTKKKHRMTSRGGVLVEAQTCTQHSCNSTPPGLGLSPHHSSQRDPQDNSDFPGGLFLGEPLLPPVRVQIRELRLHPEYFFLQVYFPQDIPSPCHITLPSTVGPQHQIHAASEFLSGLVYIRNPASTDTESKDPHHHTTLLPQCALPIFVKKKF